MHSRPLTRASLALRVAGIALVIAIPAFAEAPADQYVGFDSTSPSVKDDFTKLVWDRPRPPLGTIAGTADGYPGAVSQTDAASACAKVGMRLPSLKELLTLVDEAPHAQYIDDHNEARFIDKQAFFNTPSGEFWTSTLQASNRAYTVDFASGLAHDTATNQKLAFRCVDYKPKP